MKINSKLSVDVRALFFCLVLFLVTCFVLWDYGQKLAETKMALVFEQEKYSDLLSVCESEIDTYIVYANQVTDAWAKCHYPVNCYVNQEECLIGLNTNDFESGFNFLINSCLLTEQELSELYQEIQSGVYE